MNILRASFPHLFEDDDIITVFTNELKQVDTVLQLENFVGRWKLLWTASSEYKPVIISAVGSHIVSPADETDLKCIKLSFEDKLCEHSIKGEFCSGMEIRLPWTLLVATQLATKYGVPVEIAWHQAFCPFLDHDNCF